MSFEAIGLFSGKVYATGSRADCFRYLHQAYPSVELNHRFNKHGVGIDQVYPEPIKIIRVTKRGKVS